MPVAGNTESGTDAEVYYLYVQQGRSLAAVGAKKAVKILEIIRQIIAERRQRKQWRKIIRLLAQMDSVK